MPLSNKQEAFVEAYIATYFNATEAARRAGYTHPNKQGSRLLVNVGIAAEIKRRVAEQAMGPDEVLLRLGEQARNEHGNYITENGSVDLPRLIADGKGHLIKGIKETPQGKNIEFYDAQAALVHIGRHHKLFVEQSELKHSGKIEHSNVTDLTDEELDTIARRSSSGTAKA